MKEFYIKDLKKDIELTDFFMVKSLAFKTGSNGKTFLDITLGDMTGEISAKKWDVLKDEAEVLSKINEGDIVKVKALVTEWNNMRQLRVTRIRAAVESDGLEISDYIKAAPEPPAEMYAYIHNEAEAMTDGDLRKLAQLSTASVL